MTRNRVLAMVAVLCLAFLVTAPALAAKDYRAERFDVGVDIQKDGSLIVTETIKFSFIGGPFTYVFRDISRNGTDNISILDTNMDGVVFPTGTGARQVEIKDSDPIEVTWHFPPTSDSSHEFVLRYRVQGVIRTGQADTLIWQAIPESHDYSIDGSSVTITYPLDKHPLKAPILDRTFESVALENGFRLTTGKLDADESLILTIQFGSGSLVTQSPAWQALQEQKNRRISLSLPYGLGAAGITGVLGLLWLVLMGGSFRRGTNDYSGVTQEYSVPPASIPAALAARLTGSSFAFLGTFFDLAGRGVLRIEEGPKKWGSLSFEVIHQPVSELLEPHEQVFLDAFFHKGKNDRVALSSIARMAYNSQFTRTLDQELTTHCWRETERSARRKRFLVQAVFGLALGLPVLGAGLILGGLSLSSNNLAVIIGAILTGIGVSACILGLVGLIVAVSISTQSELGLQQASAWKSFSGYLKNIMRGRETIPSPDIFERYLPYAAAFGIASEWAKFFQKVAGVPIPKWFQGVQSSLQDGSFAAIVAAVHSADSSASAGAGGGAGGASGGGASGAG